MYTLFLLCKHTLHYSAIQLHRGHNSLNEKKIRRICLVLPVGLKSCECSGPPIPLQCSIWNSLYQNIGDINIYLIFYLEILIDVQVRNTGFDSRSEQNSIRA